MPNSHAEICASLNSLLTFCPRDISLKFSDSIHQDIWAIVEKNQRKKNQRGIDGKERKKIKRPRHEKKEKREKYTQDRAHMFSSLSLLSFKIKESHDAERCDQNI